MYVVKDSQGTVRGASSTEFKTVNEALCALADSIDMDPERYPQEFPFTISHKATSLAVLVIDLPPELTQ